MVAADTIHTTADGRRLLVMHGDQFDGVVTHAKWLAYLTNRDNTLTILQASGFISPRQSISPDEYATGVFAEHFQ